MFWKLLEIIVRLVYFRRFRSARKIGEAGALLRQGRPEDALVLLEKTGCSLHESLLPLYAFTRGKILSALQREADAEASFQTVVLADPKNARADLELAVLTGRRFRFEDCRTWLNRAIDKDDEDVRRQAEGILIHLDQIESGRAELEYSMRANKMATRQILGQQLGMPPDPALLDRWIARDPEEARNDIDEIALLMGQSKVEEGGVWKISLAIEDSIVVEKDGSFFYPFESAAAHFPDK